MKQIENADKSLQICTFKKQDHEIVMPHNSQFLFYNKNLSKQTQQKEQKVNKTIKIHVTNVKGSNETGMPPQRQLKI